MNWIFTKNSLLSSAFEVFSEISFIVSLRGMTPDTAPSQFPWHRLCTTDHRTFSLLSFCLATVSRLHAFFAFYLKNKITMRSVQNRGFKHCGNPALSGALACDFREVGDTVVWTVDGRRVIVHGSFLIELLELITCVENGLGQVAKLLVAGAEVRLTRAFGSGKFGKIVRTGASVRLVSKCQVKEQQRTKKRIMRVETCALQQTPLFMTLSHACVCDTHENVRMCAMNALCAEKCACNRWLRVHHPSKTQYLPLRGYDPSLFLKKIITPWPSWENTFRLHFRFILISPTRTWSTSLHSTNHQMYELMLLGFPRHNLLIFDFTAKDHEQQRCHCTFTDSSVGVFGRKFPPLSYFCERVVFWAFFRPGRCFPTGLFSEAMEKVYCMQCRLGEDRVVQVVLRVVMDGKSGDVEMTWLTWWRIHWCAKKWHNTILDRVRPCESALFLEPKDKHAVRATLCVQMTNTNAD